jgi:type I restriction enzyme R subunit
MTPEEKARVHIDQMFSDAGWKVVSRDEYSPTLSAAAIKEGILKGGKEADYLLFINGKAVGVLEAKKASTNVSSERVIDQAEGYTQKLTKYYQFYAKPLPIVYVSNGQVTLFRDSDGSYIPVGSIHTPKEICKMLGIEDEFAGLPTLKKKGLRDCQYEAITELEKSFRAGQKRAYMVLATGAGKTYTACMASYRFLSYTPIRRVLFLVDRNNLGKQAEDEFGKFKLTETGDAFNTIFTVNRLKSQAIPKDSNVVISTIQRLFSLLKGEDIEESDDDENYDGDETPTPAVTLPDNPTLPKDFFDLIIVDECHRSIYGSWRSVLEYFSSARIIGLTATPAPETEAFFNNNRVINYTLERSIADGVNVDYRVYRIKTKATEDGGAIRDGENIKQITRYTGKVENVKNSGEKTYTGNDLNRSIVNPSQIKLVLETYRDAVYTEMFNDPQREPNLDYLPKTLIFALNDAHASNIVKIAKEVFGKENDPQFVQKITYSAGNSNELIRHFRNDKEFRIAVTVTLVATGTDVKPIEVVMFMRDIESNSLYTQMKGRGVRTIGDEQLRIVTPNAISKDLFFLVDAVGVTEHEMKETRPGTDPKPATMSLKELLERITHGYVDDEYLKILASRLSRIHNKSDEKQREKFRELAGDDMKEIASRIYEALAANTLPPFVDINEPNNERKALVASLANHPDARNYLLILNAGFVKILIPGEDELVSKGFSIEEASLTTAAFEKYVFDHKDEMEALRIIYNNQGEPITYSMLKELDTQLRYYNAKFNPALLWNSYAIVRPADVVKFTTKDEKEALTNVIQLVRFAFKHIPRLESLRGEAAKFFNLWCGQSWRGFTEKQNELLGQIVNYIVSNGACTIEDIKEEDKTQAGQLVMAFGGIDAANVALSSLSQFMIYRKTA